MTTTTTLTLTVAVWLVTLKVIAGWLWWRNRQLRASITIMARQLIQAGALQVQLEQNIGAEQMRKAEALARCVDAEIALGQIRHTITRRPIKRRWLAISRIVARDAGRALESYLSGVRQ